MATKKLIEVALPLDKINEASIKERYSHSGHPFQLHLYWARRPISAARAVIWASLVDDPSSHPELFPTEEAQNEERQRLFEVLEKLVAWENNGNIDVLNVAKAEIAKSTNNNFPAMIDPFAGGGALPLEAYRLGLKANAHDLNPVAVMINKAMTEIPSRFCGRAPINPDTRQLCAQTTGWVGAAGLAKDVEFYGNRLRDVAFMRVGHLYPKARIPNDQGGGESSVVAWIWTRTTKCPNPLCGCEMPLASSYVLSNKKGNEVWAEPKYEKGELKFAIHKGKCPKGKESAKQGRSAVFKCPVCGETTTDSYVKNKGKRHELGSRLMAVVAEARRGRLYLSPDEEQIIAAQVPKPDDYPIGAMPENPRWFSPPAFGMTEYSDLFNNRQLTALLTLSDLLPEIQDEIERDAIEAGISNDHISLVDNGRGAYAYAQAVIVYLAFVIDKIADYNSSLCHWQPGGGKAANTFNRQALPMVWDYAEANIFTNAYGSWNNKLAWTVDGISNIPEGLPSSVKQWDVQVDCGLRNVLVSTDPPYYDNIGYADLSDFFYVWMRRNLRSIYPDIFGTMLVPKAQELIATPYRHNGSSEKAKIFFENGMLGACNAIREYASEEFPISIFYAYKQSDTDEDNKSSSTGWETMLSAIIQSGLTITGTWPIRTELANRTISLGTNSLASSIVLVCRKRPNDAAICTRRNFINVLKRELRPALQKLQSSNIAPVDLAQSAIGPGMGVYSKYSQVLEADGTPMTVRSALKVINQELDVYLNEQDSDLDSESRFCVDLYSQLAFNEMPFGDANTLATAKNTSVAIMASHGILYAQKGKVHLIERQELPVNINDREGGIWLLCQQLTYKMEKEGVQGCAKVLAHMFGSNGERAKDLAYRLYTIAERKKWSQEAYAYNALVVAWPEIQSRAAELKAIEPKQMTIFDILPN